MFYFGSESESDNSCILFVDIIFENTYWIWASWIGSLNRREFTQWSIWRRVFHADRLIKGSIPHNSHHLYSDPQIMNKHLQQRCNCFHHSDRKDSFPTEEWNSKGELYWNGMYVYNTTSYISFFMVFFNSAIVSAGISQLIPSIFPVFTVWWHW